MSPPRPPLRDGQGRVRAAPPSWRTWELTWPCMALLLARDHQWQVSHSQPAKAVEGVGKRDKFPNEEETSICYCFIYLFLFYHSSCIAAPSSTLYSCSFIPLLSLGVRPHLLPFSLTRSPFSLSLVFLSPPHPPHSHPSPWLSLQHFQQTTPPTHFFSENYHSRAS